jgi:hypothetical protein
MADAMGAIRPQYSPIEDNRQLAAEDRQYNSKAAVGLAVIHWRHIGMGVDFDK